MNTMQSQFLQHTPRAYSGVITIFLALIFVCISALVLTLVESARVAGLHYHLKLAANSALESLFSEYNNQLWDDYRIPSYEYRSEDLAMQSIERYMQPYMETRSWMRMDSVDARPTRVTTLTQGEGEYFEQEVLSYMNYGFAESLFDIEAYGDVDTLWDNLKESKTISETTNDYATQSRKAIEAEESLEAIDDSLSRQKSLKASAMSALRRGSGNSFDRLADSMISEMRRMAGNGSGGGLICDYETASYDLENELDRVDAAHAGSYADLSSAGQDVVMGVKSDYTGYSSTEKNRRDEAEEIYAITQNNIAIIYDAKETADMIEELEEEIAEERAERAKERSSDPNYDPSPSQFRVKLYDLWRDLADAFSAVDIHSIGSEHGIADKTKKNFLETAKSILSGEILNLVVPEGSHISGTALTFKGDTSQSGRSLPYLSITDKAMMAEYIGHYFTEFTDEQRGVASYEMEYICAGRGADRDNLSSAVAQVFAIREGLNYLHIMMDGSKRSEAHALAQEIVIGASGGTMEALVPVIECLVIAVWAGAESVIDCRTLLSGNKVALYKSADQWKTDTSSILQWGQTRRLAGSNRGDENGLTYEQYLKFLTLLLNPRERNSRAMDIIELNLNRSEPDFMMSNCIYGINIEVTANCTHIFTSLPVISADTAGFSKHFSMTTGARKEY